MAHPETPFTETVTIPEMVVVLKAAITKLMGWRMVLAGICKFFNTTCQFFFPICILNIIRFLEEVDGQEDVDPTEGIAWAFLMLFVMCGKAFLENAYFYLTVRTGWRIRSAITTAVFNKALRMSAVSRQTKSLGEIVNLQQLDSKKLENFMNQVHIMWDGLFQIVGYLTILYMLIGWACFVGLGVMVLAMPLQGYIFAMMYGIDRKMTKQW